MPETKEQTRVAVIGTGKMGRALAARLAAAGHAVTIGSRRAESADEAAFEVNQRHTGRPVSGLVNLAAAESAAIVLLSVPFAAQHDVLLALAPALEGKILVTTVAALDPAAAARVSLPAGSSAALEAQRQLGGGVRVVSAFQTIMYRSLLDPPEPVAPEAFVAGDDQAAKDQVIELGRSIGVRAWDVGPLVNGIATEAFTSIQIHLIIQHGVKTPGLRLIGVPHPPDLADPV